jgi:hypothetical protein
MSYKEDCWAFSNTGLWNMYVQRRNKPPNKWYKQVDKLIVQTYQHSEGSSFINDDFRLGCRSG